MAKVKDVLAAVLAWIDGNPRKAFLAGWGVGVVMGWVL